jgi:transposase-like protein
MSNKKRTGRPSKYPLEFQRDAVAMVLDEERSIADVARAIGVNEGTLGNWVAKARRERAAGAGVTADRTRRERTVAGGERTAADGA